MEISRNRDSGVNADSKVEIEKKREREDGEVVAKTEAVMLQKIQKVAKGPDDAYTMPISVEMASGAVHEGQFKNRRLHGEGKITYKGGDIEKDEGQFEDGRIVKGSRTLRCGTVYTGDFQNNKPHGEGEAFYQEGDIEKDQGRFENGEIVWGAMTLRSGLVYRGDFKKRIPHGDGTMIYSGGPVREDQGQFRDGEIIWGKRTMRTDDFYQGPFVNQQPHGKGMVVYNEYNEGPYEKDEGDFEEGLFVRGVRTLRNGDVYEGEFLKGGRLLRGTITFEDETIKKAVGEFQENDLFEGSLFYEDGSIYTGTTKNFEPYGVGMLNGPNDSYKFLGYFEGATFTGTLTKGDEVYRGMCRDQKPHGLGVLKKDRSRNIVGTFNGGKLEEHGSYPCTIFSGGSFYYGQLVNNQAEGKGMFVYSDGKYYIGQCVKGKPLGEGILFQPDGRVIKNGKWAEGKAAE